MEALDLPCRSRRPNRSTRSGVSRRRRGDRARPDRERVHGRHADRRVRCRRRRPWSSKRTRRNAREVRPVPPRATRGCIEFDDDLVPMTAQPVRGGKLVQPGRHRILLALAGEMGLHESRLRNLGSGRGRIRANAGRPPGQLPRVLEASGRAARRDLVAALAPRGDLPRWPSPKTAETCSIFGDRLGPAFGAYCGAPASIDATSRMRSESLGYGAAHGNCFRSRRPRAARQHGRRDPAADLGAIGVDVVVAREVEDAVARAVAARSMAGRGTSRSS